MISTVSFFPKHFDLSEEDHDKAIVTYREWLDQHGDYGRLYMMDIGRAKNSDGEKAFNSTQIGLRIFDPEVAMFFRLFFNL